MSSTLPPTNDAVVDRLIAEYLQAAEAGQAPARQEFLARYPEHAEALRRFFGDFDRMERDVTSLRLEGPATLDYPTGPVGTLPRVRYFGDYELLDEIARGGIGVVYKARQVSLDRLVALKMLLKGEFASDKDAARFRAEAEAAAALDHPSIVPVYEVGKHEGRQYLAMKYIEGRNLAATPRAEVRTEVTRVMAIARAVHFAHQRGVLHRDLKPGNILVDDAGVPYVADFGLAKRVDAETSLSESGDVVGTPRYMAPEQALGKRDLTTAVDVYALGVILYERLTGQTPLRGNTLTEMLRLLREEEPTRPGTMNPAVDADLDTICLKCLEKEPSRRYASADAVADELRRWLAGEPIVARPAPALERVRKWIRRRPAVAGLLALAAAAVVLLVLGTWFHITSINEQVDLRDEALEKLKREQETTQGLLKQETTLREDLGKALEREQQTSYVYRIPIAAREVAANSIGKAREILESTPAHLRGWEWKYLMRLCAGDILRIHCPKGGWMTFVVSEDGQELITGQYQDVVVYNATTGAEVRRWKAHEKPIKRVVLSLDGSCLATMEGEFTQQPTPHEIKLWKLPGGDLLQTLKLDSTELLSIAFNRDSTRLAAGGRQREVTIFDVATGQVLRKLPTGQAFSLAYAAKDQLVVGVWQRGVTVWDEANSQLALTLKGKNEPLSGSWCVAVSPDGKLIGAATNLGRQIRVWDLGAEKPRVELSGHLDMINDMVFSTNNTKLITSSDDQTARVWDLEQGVQIKVLRGHAASVRTVKLSRDGSLVYTSGTDNTFRAWSRDGDASGFNIEHGNSTSRSIAFHPTQPLLAYALNRRSIRFYHLSNHQDAGYLGDEQALVDGFGYLTFNRQGTRLASTWDDTTVKLWDPQTRQEVLAMTGLGKVTYTRPMGFDVSGEWLALAGPAGVVEVRSSRDGSLSKTLPGHPQSENAYAILWLKRDNLLVTSGRGSIILWDVSTGQPRMTLETDRQSVVSLTTTPDETLLAGLSVSGHLFLWKVADGSRVYNRRVTSRRGVAIDFSPDGKRLATMAEDGFIYFWDVAMGQELYSLRVTGMLPTSMRFSPDGRYLAASGLGQKVKVYDNAPVETKVVK